MAWEFYSPLFRDERNSLLQQCKQAAVRLNYRYLVADSEPPGVPSEAKIFEVQLFLSLWSKTVNSLGLPSGLEMKTQYAFFHSRILQSKRNCMRPALLPRKPEAVGSSMGEPVGGNSTSESVLYQLPVWFYGLMNHKASGNIIWCTILITWGR